MLLLVISVSGASALDFTSSQRVYREDYEGELAFPTTPEIDLAGAGGGTGVDVFGGGGAPQLTGGAARVTLTGMPFLVGEGVAFAPGTLADGDAGFRAEFAGLVMVGTGESFILLNAEFSSDAGVQVQLDVFQDAPLQTSSLVVREFDGLTDFEVSTVALSSSETAALLSGAAFELDLFVDRDVSRALGSIQIDGFPGSTQTQIGLTLLGSTPLDSVAHLIVFSGGPTATTQLDMTEFAMYTGLPRALNLDIGTTAGTPSAGYAAAGIAGVWNEVGLGTTALVDLAGNPTSVSVTLTTQSDTGGLAGPEPDQRALLGDHAFECIGNPDVWSLNFSGLTPGGYRVLIYAPAASAVFTGALTVNGVAAPNLTGDSGFQLIEGVSWGAVVTSSDGTIDISGSDGTVICAGVAGVQLIPQLPPQVPLLSAPTRAALALLLACSARLLYRRHATRARS